MMIHSKSVGKSKCWRERIKNLGGRGGISLGEKVGGCN